MKKLVTVSSVIAIFAASSAFAKTEGSYVGVSLLSTKSQHQYKNSDGTSITAGGKFSNTSSRGYGLDYKYAFNFNNVFVAPGVFFDKLGTSAGDNAGLGEPVEIKNRYGVKLDIGYDITDQIGVYFTNGFAKTRYTVDWTGGGAGTKAGVTPLHYFTGIGALFHATKNITLNVEYNTQHISGQTPEFGVTVRSKIDVVKAGISYHF